MNNDQKLKELINAVKKVRENQKAYFKARKTQLPMVIDKLLKDSKESERELDQLIIKLEQPEDTQTTLL
jgi:3-oxoacyl-[acyl-carrier-protein] synthase III